MVLQHRNEVETQNIKKGKDSQVATKNCGRDINCNKSKSDEGNHLVATYFLGHNQ